MDLSTDLKDAREISMPVGVVVRRLPGVTRWATHSWRPVAVLPGAGPAEWAELRREAEAVEFHAGTLPLTLYRSDTEAYLNGLSARVPCVFVVMEEDGGAQPLLREVTASPYDAQDHLDNGELLVEKVPMPPQLLAWVEAFADAHHEDEAFVKRRRKDWRNTPKEDGKGDARIRQLADVYRSPTRRRDQ